MPICIYCNEREADSKEHAIPAALGMDYIKGFEKLHGKLCSSCNNDIGKIEEQFLRSGPEAYLRSVLKIKRRKGSSGVNPFLRGSAGVDAIKAELKDPESDTSFLCEPADKPGNMTHLYQLLMRDSQGEIHHVIIPESIQSSEALNEMLMSKGMADYELEHVHIASDNK